MRYEEYKQTGIKWITSIPVSWEIQKIGTLFAQRKEKVSDKIYAPISVTKNGILPQLATAAKTDDGDNRKKVCVGDFVINSRSDRKGSCGVSALEGSVSLINIVLQPRKQLTGSYAHYLLRSQPFSEEFYRNGRGIVADLWTTRYSEMKTILLPVPPREEQDQIVRYLDWQVSKINRLIAAKRKQITLLKEQKQRRITHIVTHGIKPNVPHKDSGIAWIGAIPAHWHCVALKRCAKVKSGITLGKQYPVGTKLVSVPYLRVANVQDGFVSIETVTTLNVTPEEAAQYALPKGCVLMTEGGDRDKLGRGCVWNGEIENCIHQNHIFAVTVNDKLLLNKWLEYVSACDIGRMYFDITAIKTTNLACTNASKVMAFPIPLPPRDEQERITDELNRVARMFNDIRKGLEKQIERLQELRTRLISDVVTGQVDVRGIEVPEFEMVNEIDTEEPIEEENDQIE